MFFPFTKPKNFDGILSFTYFVNNHIPFNDQVSNILSVKENGFPVFIGQIRKAFISLITKALNFLAAVGLSRAIYIQPGR